MCLGKVFALKWWKSMLFPVMFIWWFIVPMQYHIPCVGRKSFYIRIHKISWQRTKPKMNREKFLFLVGIQSGHQLNITKQRPLQRVTKVIYWPLHIKFIRKYPYILLRNSTYFLRSKRSNMIHWQPVFIRMKMHLEVKLHSCKSIKNFRNERCSH